MRKYIVRKEQDKFIIGHKNWFNIWKTDYKFNNINSFVKFVYKSKIWLDDLIWEFPKPSFEQSNKTPIGHIIEIDFERFFSSYFFFILDKGIDTTTADLSFVYDPNENIYKVVEKPFNEFIEPFKSNNCFPCWSIKASNEYEKLIEEVKRIEDNKIRIGTEYFETRDEYEKWRNENPHVKILKFKETSGPWSVFNYEVTYEYRNIDKP